MRSVWKITCSQSIFQRCLNEDLIIPKLEQLLIKINLLTVLTTKIGLAERSLYHWCLKLKMHLLRFLLKVNETPSLAAKKGQIRVSKSQCIASTETEKTISRLKHWMPLTSATKTDWHTLLHKSGRKRTIPATRKLVLKVPEICSQSMVWHHLMPLKLKLRM